MPINVGFVSYERAREALSGSRFADLRSVAETGSTNADMRGILADRAAGNPGAGEGPVILIADHQSAGRGRLDREWHAPAGTSMLMSIGCSIEQVPPPRRTLLTMCLSLAVIEALSVTGLEAISIKWPNDIVLTDEDDPRSATPSPYGYRKIGGVLAEVAGQPGQGMFAVLGLGLNVNWDPMPEELAPTAISLSEVAGAPVDMEDLLVAVVTRFDVNFAQLEDPDWDIRGLLGPYASHCSTLGREVGVELVNDSVAGVAEGVAADGALEVRVDGELRRVTAGDVVHLRPTV